MSDSIISVSELTRRPRRNRCAAEPAESEAAADVTCLEYTDCADDAAVVLYTVKDAGHSWPGGGLLPEWFVRENELQRRRHEGDVGVLSRAAASVEVALAIGRRSLRHPTNLMHLRVRRHPSHTVLM